MLVFFFFKQKTAYEMRISDWSSDVCSSDLVPCDAADHRRAAALGRFREGTGGTGDEVGEAGAVRERRGEGARKGGHAVRAKRAAGIHAHLRLPQRQIGRASWRERVCQYV